MDSELALTANSEKDGNCDPRLPIPFSEYEHIKLSSWGYPLKSHKFRYPLRFACVEAGDKEIPGDNHHPRSHAQAQRCPRCSALVAVGHSFEDHLFFCDRHSNIKYQGPDPLTVMRGVQP